MKFFLDTNIIIYAVKGTFPAIQEHFMAVSPSNIFVPSIVKAELEFGARNSNNYEKSISLYNRFISQFSIVDFSEKAAVEYGVIRKTLASAGKIIGANDMLIAAIALANDGAIVTHNVDEFSRIPNLKVIDWT